MARHPASLIIPGEKYFRWRGSEISRIEAFTDTVFGFAVALIIVSGEVPKSYAALMQVVRGFVAFAICFALLINLWFQHYLYSRRYALETYWSIFLTCLLLFFTLFYVYPLKFLFVRLVDGAQDIDAAQARVLYLVYGAGTAAVFGTLTLMYVHAWRLREALELTAVERLKTIQTLINHIAAIAIALISMLLAVTLPDDLIGIAGLFYFMLGVHSTVAGFCFRVRQRRLLERLPHPEASGD